MAAAGEKDVWFITGCSSGIGAALAKHIYDAGCSIIATARKPDTLAYLPDEPNVLKLALDITDPDQVAHVVKAGVERFGRLDVVVNNAGYGLTADSENVPDAEARAQLETNFWGAVSVTKAALPVLRETNPVGKGGLIIQISSVGGRVCFPGKFALEGYTEALAKEMHPDWNIKFLIIQLGSFKTKFADNIHLVARHPAYRDPKCGYNQLAAYFENQAESSKHWTDPAACAKVLYEVASTRNQSPLPVRLSLGADAHSLIQLELEKALREHEDWKSVARSTTSGSGFDAVEIVSSISKGSAAS
ncbi:hypothetical protein A1O3_00176 [Capronia epimyces CBS 606.96]|uniref:Oxidoreductase n=1 Tax=Capronia epimyces CBS 606.96 TaxID=1182542 RepID=W9YQT3_9EURO|nr:uncharacterized protein A1O3_00176 [Capronia epimyces CBS 606.96]EXJ91626.1 hypothetical protein A1O3_00176 [Capronia epimyces CBS 606.96]